MNRKMKPDDIDRLNLETQQETPSDLVANETVPSVGSLTVGGDAYASPSVETPKNEMLSQAGSNKFLYETRLQDVFNDYQQNVATLGQQQQEQLQDAYFIREMSKKYLGEYASNVGIGDVSGNLIDIYGQYQQNISDIDKFYNQLELGLQKTYSDERFKLMSGIMQEQFNLDIEAMEGSARDILFNISQGETDGLDDFAYLERAFEQGLLTQELYQTAVLGLQELNFEEIFSVIENDGYLINFESAVEYTEANKDKMADRQYQSMLTYAKAKDLQKAGLKAAEAGRIDIDPTLFTSNREVTKDSKAFEIAGVNYATVKKDITNDSKKIGNEQIKNSVSVEQLNLLAAEEGTNFAFVPELNTFFFRDTNNKWYRLDQLGPSSTTGASLSNVLEQTYTEGSPNFEITKSSIIPGNNRYLQQGTFNVKINDMQYITKQGSAQNARNPELSNVYNKFLEVHGQKNRRGIVSIIKNNSAVEFNGKFYLFKDNEIHTLDRR